MRTSKTNSIIFSVLIFTILLSLMHHPRIDGTSIGMLKNNSDNASFKFAEKLINNNYCCDLNKFLLIEQDNYGGSSWMDGDQWMRVYKTLLPKSDGVNQLKEKSVSILGGQINEIIVPQIRDLIRSNSIFYSYNADAILIRVSKFDNQNIFPLTSDIQISFDLLRKKILENIINNSLDSIGLSKLDSFNSPKDGKYKFNIDLLRISNRDLWHRTIINSVCSRAQTYYFCKQPTNLRNMKSFGEVFDTKLNTSNGALYFKMKKMELNFGYFYIHWIPQTPTCAFRTSDQMIWGSNGNFVANIIDLKLLDSLEVCSYVLRIWRQT